MFSISHLNQTRHGRFRQGKSRSRGPWAVGSCARSASFYNEGAASQSGTGSADRVAGVSVSGTGRTRAWSFTARSNGVRAWRWAGDV